MPHLYLHLSHLLCVCAVDSGIHSPDGWRSPCWWPLKLIWPRRGGLWSSSRTPSGILPWFLISEKGASTHAVAQARHLEVIFVGFLSSPSASLQVLRVVDSTSKMYLEAIYSLPSPLLPWEAEHWPLCKSIHYAAARVSLRSRTDRTPLSFKILQPYSLLLGSSSKDLEGPLWHSSLTSSPASLSLKTFPDSRSLFPLFLIWVIHISLKMWLFRRRPLLIPLNCLK